MELIGMSDSPFVRRVAISAKRLGLSFEHEQISVMRQFEAFSAYNPLVKAHQMRGGVDMATLARRF